MRKIDKSRVVLVLLLMYTMDTQPIGSSKYNTPCLRQQGNMFACKQAHRLPQRGHHASMNSMMGNGTPCIFIDSKGYL